MFKEFKEFAMQGNLVDIAVAFVMGAAFGKVITTFTTGIIAPIIALIVGSVHLDELKLVLRAAEVDAAGKVITPEAAILYGSFVTAVIDFIIVAFVMFLMVKGINTLKREKAGTYTPAPSNEAVLLSEIRDLLKK